MRTNEEVLSFSQQVLGYYDNDELENLLRLVRSLPKDATIVEIGVEYGRSASIYLQCHENWEWLVLVDSRTHNAESGRKSTSNLINTFIKCHDSVCVSNWELTSKEASEMDGDDYVHGVDLLHIDADHTASGVATDLRCWANRVKVGGYIVFHDYHRFGPDGPVFADYTNEIDKWLNFQLHRWVDNEIIESAQFSIESNVNTQLVLRRNF